MNREDKRGIFFGVVGVLTLIVAIIGASLAYFSINAKSDPDAVTVQAATVQIVYESGTKLKVDNIIPSSKTVATTTFDRYFTDTETYDKCKDDNGKTVCGTYNFTLKNKGDSATTITMVVKPTSVTLEDGSTPKKFKNLSYILYDISGDDFVLDETTGDYISETETPTVLKEGTFNSVNSTDDDGNVTVSAYEDTVIVNYDSVNTETNLSIPANSERRYRLFIYLAEANGEQDYEQGAVFQGQISIEVAGSSSTITGTLND